MNCKDLCHLFCCPPLPSRIAAKLAFLPPPPTYSIFKKDSTDGHAFYEIHMNDGACIIDSEMEKLELFRARTARGQDIACLYVKMNPQTKTTILMSHGNAVDLGLMAGFMLGLANKLKVNILSYDYSGYGMSTGRPSEKDLYADVECALDALMERYNVPLDQIVFYGQSIGTAPTVDLATRRRPALVVLHSPLLSGLQVACPGTTLSPCCDVFRNKDKVAQISAPTLVIHGTEDEVIDYHHGEQINELLPNKLEPLFIVGAGHNDCELFPQYLERLRKVIDPDLRLLHRIITQQNNSQHYEGTASSNPSSNGSAQNVITTQPNS